MEKYDRCEKEFDTPEQLRGHMMHHKRYEDNQGEAEAERKQRVPLGVLRPKLAAKVRSGRVGRWLNDDGGRINDGLDGGYEFEKDKEGNKIRKTVGKRKDGSEIHAYLMSIDKTFYDEDQATKQADINKVEEQIFSGKYDEKPGENRYVPKSGISVSVTN